MAINPLPSISPAAAGAAFAHRPESSSTASAAAFAAPIQDPRNLLTDNRGAYEKHLWHMVGEYAPECALFLQGIRLNEEAELATSGSDRLVLEEILMTAVRKPGRAPSEKMASLRVVEQVLRAPVFAEISLETLGQALSSAANNNHEAVVNALLRCPRFRNISGDWIGWSMINAAHEGNIDIVNALIRCSRFGEISARNLGLALKHAAQNGHRECVNALIRCPRIGEISHIYGPWARELAIQNGHQAIANDLRGF